MASNTSVSSGFKSQLEPVSNSSVNSGVVISNNVNSGSAMLAKDLGLVSLKTNLNLTNIILIVKFDYEAKEPHELDLKKYERLILIDNTKNWWLVKKCDSDQTGLVC